MAKNAVVPLLAAGVLAFLALVLTVGRESAKQTNLHEHSKATYIETPPEPLFEHPEEVEKHPVKVGSFRDEQPPPAPPRRRPIKAASHRDQDGAAAHPQPALQFKSRDLLQETLEKADKLRREMASLKKSKQKAEKDAEEATREASLAIQRANALQRKADQEKLKREKDRAEVKRLEEEDRTLRAKAAKDKKQQLKDDRASGGLSKGPTGIVVPRLTENDPTAKPQILEDAVLWDDGYITVGNGTVGEKVVLERSRSEGITLWKRNMPPNAMDKPSVSFGSMDKAVIFCEFWSLTSTMWLTDCLPRLTRYLSWAETEEGRKAVEDPRKAGSCIPLVISSEYYIVQYIREALGFAEECTILLPAHMMWQWDHAPLFILVKKAWVFPHRSHIPQLDRAPGEPPADEGREKDSKAEGKTDPPEVEALMIKDVRLGRDLIIDNTPGLRDPHSSWDGTMEGLHLAADASDESRAVVKKFRSKQLCERPMLMVISERCDMTHPADILKMVETFCKELDFCAICAIVRFETLRVLDMLRLSRRIDVLLGAPGGGMLPSLFMQEGGLVVEMLPVKVDRPPPLVKQDLATINKNKDIYPIYPRIKIGMFAEALGFRFTSLRPAVDVEIKRPPVFSPTRILREMRLWAEARSGDDTFSKRPAEVPSYMANILHLSRKFIPCSGLYHLKKTFRLLGLSKDTYLIANRSFALKVANSDANHSGGKFIGGDWRQVEKEMRLLRNTSERRITKAEALCFDNPKPFYAQERFAMQLGQQGQTKPVPIANTHHWHLALAGYLDLWMAHRERENRFLFYCDAGPKNWAISSQQDRLQMYDLDETLIILPGTLCSEERNCGCADSRVQACVDNRCTLSGMQSKQTTLVHDWVKGFVMQLTPKAVRANPAVVELKAKVKENGLKCQYVVDYLKANTNNVTIPVCPDDVELEAFNKPKKPKKGHHGKKEGEAEE